MLDPVGDLAPHLIFSRVSTSRRTDAAQLGHVANKNQSPAQI